MQGAQKWGINTTSVDRLGERANYDCRKGPPSKTIEEKPLTDWLIELANCDFGLSKDVFHESVRKLRLIMQLFGWILGNKGALQK